MKFNRDKYLNETKQEVAFISGGYVTLLCCVVAQSVTTFVSTFAEDSY